MTRAEVEAMLETLSGDSYLARPQAEALARDWLRMHDREQTIRKLLGRYPEMNNDEAADAAGDVAALFFTEQGAALAEGDEG